MRTPPSPVSTFRRPSITAGNLHAVSISCLVGVLSACISHLIQPHTGDPISGDLKWALVGARDLLSGIDPYSHLTNSAPLYYPLPALLVAAPFSFIDPALSAAFFCGAAGALMSYAIMRTQGPAGLIVFFSPTYFWCLKAVQWAPLMYAAALVPGLLPLASAKPSLALCAFLFKPRSRPLLVVILLWIACWAIWPSWPSAWLASLRDSLHVSPALIGPGPLLPLALLRWRLPQARLLAALAIIPQRFVFYDQLLVLLVARSERERLFLVTGTCIAFVGWWCLGPIWSESWTGSPLDYPAGWLLLFLYIPALGVVLRQKPHTDRHTEE